MTTLIVIVFVLAALWITALNVLTLVLHVAAFLVWSANTVATFVRNWRNR